MCSNIKYVDQCSGMDYYTNNFGGAYHDQFYTMANVTDSYKTYISHVLNRNNTLTGVQYKVIQSTLQTCRQSGVDQLSCRMILLSLDGNW